MKVPSVRPEHPPYLDAWRPIVLACVVEATSNKCGRIGPHRYYCRRRWPGGRHKTVLPAGRSTETDALEGLDLSHLQAPNPAVHRLGDDRDQQRPAGASGQAGWVEAGNVPAWTSLPCLPLYATPESESSSTTNRGLSNHPSGHRCGRQGRRHRTRADKSPARPPPCLSSEPE